MGFFREPQDEEVYRRYRAEGHLEGGCRLCDSPSIKEFEHWRIVKNNFPYTRIAKLHHMILPKRHVIETELSQEEWMEYNQLKHSYINDTYEFMIEPTQNRRSIPQHIHIHLVIAKD